MGLGYYKSGEWKSVDPINTLSTSRSSGGWLSPATSAITNTIRGSNEMYFTPMVFDADTDIAETGIYVVTAAASSFVRLGVYSENNDGVPADLVIDLGTVDTSSTGVKTIVSSYTLKRGRYWFVTVSQPGSPTLRTCRPTIRGFGDSATTVYGLALGETSVVYRRDGITGALPSTTSPQYGRSTYTATIFSVKVA